MELPETTYADAAGVRIAYQQFGSGPTTICMVTNLATNIDGVWSIDAWADMAAPLAGAARVLIFDHRGTGASDRVRFAEGPAEQVEDIRAVLDAAGVGQTYLFATDLGAPAALHFAAAEPDRTLGVILVAPTAHLEREDDYPVGLPPEVIAAARDLVVSGWGRADSPYLDLMYPEGDTSLDRSRAQLARVQRQAISQSDVPALFEQWRRQDAHGVVGQVSAPVLILHSTGDLIVPVEHGRWLAAHLREARLVEFDGAEHFLWDLHRREMVREILAFVGAGSVSDGQLLALVMTDVVGSTERASALGPVDWRQTLERHEASVRRLLERYGGAERGTAGDSFLASFDSARAAVMFAVALSRVSAESDVSLRVGVHVGDVQLREGGLHGLAVHVVQRVEAAAAAGQVATTGAVREALVGVGEVRWTPLGVHQLKGVPGEWPLWQATGL